MILDAKADRVLKAISRKTRPYADLDISRACHLSLATVRLRLDRLKAANLVHETWRGERGPFWMLGPDPLGPDP